MLVIKGVKDSYNFVLSKMNGNRLGIINVENINSISRGIEKITEISFVVNRFYGVDNKINLLYDEIKNERFIYLDDEECLVIKDIKEKNENEKTVTAFSREKNLYKIDVDGVEDISLTLKTPYKDISNCYALTDLLYEQTGWKLGRISDKVLYDSVETIIDIIKENENVALTTNEKLRYQESAKVKWYDFIANDISEQFECYPMFNSYNKTIDLLDERDIGSNSYLMLTYDNYIKNLESTSSSEEIYTRLTLEGNEGITIVDVNPSGNKFIEDYSYFIDNKEMSDNLINALNLYEIMTNIRIDEWNRLILDKESKQKEYDVILKDLSVIFQKILSLEIAIEKTTDEIYKAKLIEQLTSENDKKALLNPKADSLNSEIIILNGAISHINDLCKKEKATDNNGDLIFNQLLLDELKNFYFQTTYTNDSLTDSKSLMKVGKKKLKKMSEPIKTWNIDSENFKKRMITNGFRESWRGEIGIGDSLMFKGVNIFENIFLVGYTQNFKDGSLDLELSNRKMNKDFSLDIGEILTRANTSFNRLNSNQYIFNMVKNKRIGMNYDKINGQLT
ncbi:MAG: hypothetical protein RR478_01495 [Bacilli bacterium]